MQKFPKTGGAVHVPHLPGINPVRCERMDYVPAWRGKRGVQSACSKHKIVLEWLGRPAIDMACQMRMRGDACGHLYAPRGGGDATSCTHEYLRTHTAAKPSDVQ